MMPAADVVWQPGDDCDQVDGEPRRLQSGDGEWRDTKRKQQWAVPMLMMLKQCRP